MPGLVAYVDPEYRYRFVNQNYAEWFQRPVPDIDGRTIAELGGQDAFDCMRPNLDRALAGEPVEFESNFEDTDRKGLCAPDVCPIAMQRAAYAGLSS